MNHLSRRRLLGLAGAGAAGLALSGCAGTDIGFGDRHAKQESQGPLQFWSNHPGKSKAIEQGMIDVWNRQHPDTPAQLVDAGANYEQLSQKFNAALAGGYLPDVIVASDVTWFNFAFQGATTALDPLWKDQGLAPETYVKTLLGDYEYDGSHYAVPYSRSTAIMYFRTEDVHKAGLPTDRGPATWQEFAEWAPALRKANGGKPALTLADGSNYLDWYFEGMMWALGGRYSDGWDLKFTDPATIAAAEFLQEHVQNGNIAIVKDSANDFGIGNASGLLESTGSLAGLATTASFPFHTTYLPGPAPGCPTGGAGMSIPEGISDERKAVAVRFMDFLTSTENTIAFTQATGYMPVRTDAAQQQAEQQYLRDTPNAQTALDQLRDNTRPQDAARVFLNGNGLRIGGALDRIVSNGEDVAATFRSLQQKSQSVYNRDIAPHL